MVVHFAGEGAGVGELSWGQLEILGAMERQRTWMPLPHRQALPAGATLEDIADWLRYLMGRHQVLRTRLRFPADGPPCQVVHSSGEITVDVVDAGDEDPVQVAQRVVDQHVDHDFDFAEEWPIFLAVILKDGLPVHRVLTVCHVVWDAFGGLAVLADLRERDAAGGAPPRPITAMQPLEQARWQRSPAGQRHNQAVLRHWAQLLRHMPAQRFPPPVDRGQPRHWKLQFTSPATHLAVQAIHHRTRASTAQVTLTLFLTALAKVTGINPSATRIAVNNRFRRGLTDSASVTTQYGLCILDTTDTTFDQALDQLTRKIIATFKNAYYDPAQLTELVEQISHERGQQLDIHCYYNDRRLTEIDKPTDNPPTPAEARAALPATAFSLDPLIPRGSERLFAAVEEAPGSFQLTLEADTWYLSREAMLACAHAMQGIAIAAALDPATST